MKVKKIRKNAVIPTYGSLSSAGADLYAATDKSIYIRDGETVMIPTGIAIEIPEGYMGLIFARSGLSCKNGLAPANKVGLIDSDYRGEIMVAIHNHEPMKSQDDVTDENYLENYTKRHIIEPGDRIAQLVIAPYMHMEFEEVENLDDTERGIGGFGSTGR